MPFKSISVLKISTVLAVCLILLPTTSQAIHENCADGKPVGADNCQLLLFGFYYDPETSTCKFWRKRACTVSGKNYFPTLAECEQKCMSG